MKNEEKYYNLWDHPNDAQEFLEACLSMRNLPLCAVRVRNGETPSEDFWGWLISLASVEVEKIA